ncbi:MAG: diguanylate cyclase [Betaproteobacteria bacterium]
MRQSPATTHSAADEQVALRDAHDLTACLDAIETALKRDLQSDGYFINLFQPADNTLTCARVHLPRDLASIEKTYAHYAFPANGDNANAIAFASGTPISITRKNLTEFSSVTRLAFEHWKVKHLVALPIRSASTAPVGTLTIFSQDRLLPVALVRRVKRLIEEAATLLRLHQTISTWEERAHLIRDTEAELQSLLRFVAEMSNLTTDGEIYPRIQQEFLRRFDLDFAAVLRCENGGLQCVDTRFRPVDAPWAAEWQEHCSRISYSLNINDGASSNAYMNNHPLFFGNIPAVRTLQMSEKDRANLVILPDLKSLAILPIRKNNNPIGVLWLGSMRRINSLSAEQLVLAQHLCDFLGAAIENAHTYTLVEEQRQKIEALVGALQSRVEILDQLASRDRLTGLYNYGSFEAELNKRIQIHRAQPHPLPMSLIMCDVDFFKRFNDSFGHVAGNGVLQEVANRICRTVRDNDFVARYGGEEFSILLARCNLDAAARLAERIRESIDRDPFRIDGIEHRITLSLGCAELVFNDDVSGFIARADSALYVAKQSGRNRVEVASS